MAIKHLWTFGHLIGITANDRAGTVMNAANIPLKWNVYVSGYGLCSVTAAGYLSSTPEYSGGYAFGSFSVVLSQVMDWTTRRSFFGFRYRADPYNGVNPTYRLLMTDLASGGLVLLSEANIVGFTIGTAYWVECCIDRTNNTITVWVDGNIVKTLTFDPAKLVASTTLWFGPYTGLSWQNDGGGARQYKDFYWLDDTQDASQCTRLGSLVPVVLPVSAVNASGWTTTNSDTIPNVLNAVIAGATPTDTPAAVTPANQAPLVANFGNGNITSYARVLATEFRVSAKRDTATTTTLKTALGLNSNTQNGATLSFPSSNTTVFCQRSLLAEKAPDGSIWNASNIAQATLTLTPSV